MNITQTAIRQNRVTLVLTAILVLSGIQAFFALPKAQDPGFTVRTAVVTTVFSGASPERVEQLVTDKIEKKAQEMPEVDSITSESRSGISIVNVNFKESYKDMRPIFDDLRRKISDIERELPPGGNTPIINDEFGDVFGSVYALSGDGFSNAELKDIADEIRDRLLREPDIAKVTIHGARQEVIFVDYDDSRLAALGLTPSGLVNLFGTVNILSPGGSVVSGRERIVLEPSGNFQSIDDLRQAIVTLPNGSMVYFGDIVDIYRAYQDPPASLTRSGGKPGLVLAISLREGGDILKLGARLDDIIPGIEARYPWGMQLEKIWFQAALVEKSVDDFVVNLLQAIGIVVLVMVAFMGLRTGLVVAALIPTTMIITFYLMQAFDITVNQISLAALIIALGLLVDNAIVIVELILVKRESGLSAVQAAVEAGQELRAPLLVSSLTTGAAFLPIALAESAVGEYTADIFYVVTIALLVSWLLAMTFIPMLSTKMLKSPAKAADSEPQEGRWTAAYRSLLNFVLGHRIIFIVFVLAVFYAAMQTLGLVRQEFIAPSGDPVFTGKLEFPLGTSIEASEEAIEAIDAFVESTYVTPLNGSPKVRNWLVFIGEGGPRFTLGLNPPNQNPGNSFLIANTVNGEDVTEVIAGIEGFVSANFPDMSYQFSRLENGPPVGYPVQVRISGPEIDQLYGLADEVTSYLYTTPGVSAVKNTWGLKAKKLVVDIDQQRAFRAGVSNSDIAYSLEASLSGLDLSQYREGDKLIPITLRTEDSEGEDFSKLDSLAIHSQTTAESVPLKQVADIKLVFEAGVIERRDRERTLTLKAQLHPQVTASEITALLLPWLEEQSKDWPNDFRFELGGEAEESGEANDAIIAKLPIAMMVIVLLLVVQFNSVRRPIIILATIPLGLIGVSFGLLIANSSMGFFSFLGIIALSGIIINNAIVLLDRIKLEIEELGKAPRVAIVDACLQRMRPILLTTATTVLGMMPLWWGGTAMFVPMAVAIIFGLLFATLLTLLVVPVLYAILFRV